MNRFLFLSLLICAALTLGCSKKSGSNILNADQGENITHKLQSLVDHSKEGDTIFIPKGTYSIDKNIMFYGKKDLKLFSDNATIKMKNRVPVANGFGLLAIVRSEGISVKNITFDGNRMHRSPRETACHNIGITNSNNLHFENVNSINSVVDGYYIACYDPNRKSDIPNNLVFKNCTADNSFRNGMSIINAYNLRVEGGSFSNSNGTAPAAGIDVEGNVETNHPGSKNVLLSGININDNEGVGILVSQKGSPENIDIQNSVFSQNLVGIKHTSILSEIMGNRISDSNLGIESIRYGGRKIDNNLIAENVISHCDAGIRYLGHGGNIVDNKISNCEEYGIHLNGNSSDGTMATVEKNIIKNINGDGIQANNFKSVKALGNIISDVGGYGFYLTNGSQEIIKNKISNSQFGVTSIGSHSQILNNEFIEIKQKIISFSGSSYGTTGGNVENNLFQSRSGIRDEQISIKSNKVVVKNNRKARND